MPKLDGNSNKNNLKKLSTAYGLAEQGNLSNNQKKITQLNMYTCKKYSNTENEQYKQPRNRDTTNIYLTIYINIWITIIQKLQNRL